MSKSLTRLALALLAVSLCAHAAVPQTTLEWIVLSPAGEEFTARMPKEPLRLEQDVRAEELVASGRRYTATDAGARYVIWSLKDSGNVGERLQAMTLPGWAARGESMYLDLAAEAAWKFIVEPEFERLAVERARTGEIKTFHPEMSLRREFELGGRPAREYAVRLEGEGGPVYVCTDGRRIYVVAALTSAPGGAEESRRFVDSFALTTAPAAPRAGTPMPSGLYVSNVSGPPATSEPILVKRDPPPPPANTGGDAPVNDDRPFRQNEVTQKATITFKPEPGFTESARKFNVVGVVRLRAILSKTGQLTSINVVKYLPHGLTEKAVVAARQIRFNPAQKDGHAVSQYVVLEYNFNIY